MDYEFDFGSGMPLPPPRKPAHLSNSNARANGHGAKGRRFRSFARYADAELIDYLRARHVSPSFLSEIDQFLAAHPEIAVHEPEWAHEINNSQPLDAYLWFVKGYTRPARYIEGFLPDSSCIPLVFDTVPLVKKQDPEMIEFFYAFEYRYDILERIDRGVSNLVRRLSDGLEVTHAQRKLVVLALYGNLVDVYKFYEYNYQMDWLPHRYLAEHVVLTELPTPTHHDQPVAHQLQQFDEDGSEDQRSHSGTRLRMARACDAGVDVIDVLLDEFVTLLCRRGFRRSAIESLRAEAVRNIDHQRAIGGGRDLVDMVMDKALTLHDGMKQRGKKDRKQRDRAARVEKQMHVLRRLYIQEANSVNSRNLRDALKAIRKRVERELAQDLTCLLRTGGLITQKEAAQWFAPFSKQGAKRRERTGEVLDFFQVFARFF